jgi:murein L,D-transpeptidase YafK
MKHAVKIITLWLVVFFLASCQSIPTQPPTTPEKVDRVVVHKSKRELMLIKAGKPLKTFRVALGRSPVGQKVMAGDDKTPEGTYTLDWRNPNSRFYRSLHISYPQKQDVTRAYTNGAKNPGGAIMVHGLPNGNSRFLAHDMGLDWTKGCIAVNNEEIDEIWQLVADGTPIDILP